MTERRTTADSSPGADAATLPRRATVFLSYARADKDRAVQLVEALQAAGLEVWWDELIEGGAEFARTIEAALHTCDAVVVVWSRASVGSDWVLDEAAKGRDLRKLVPVSLDGVEPPMGFRRYHSINLAGWDGGTQSPEVQAVVRGVRALDGRSSPAPVPASTASDAPPSASRRRLLVAAAGVAVAGVAGVLVWRRGGDARDARAGGNSVAVLPFQNLSAGGPHTYFAAGLHDELLTQLSKVASLTVISRTSVMGYEGTKTPLRQISQELGVGAVVEGSVQVVGDRLRVNVQLIDATTQAHLWAEHYDRTLDDAFAIQSDVAQQIVAAVGGVLTSAEQGSLTVMPTQNAEAYRLYLQGREYAGRPGYLRQNFEAAQQLYERALALDPDFALAHVALAWIHGKMYWEGLDPSPARAAHQREEAETALRLAPDLPQSHVAMGTAHYWGRRDYARALDEYAIAVKGLPNDASLWMMIGALNRRMGNWEKVFEAFDKAAGLDPRFANLFYDLGGGSYGFVRRYDDAVRAYDRALSLAPDLFDAAIIRGLTYVLWHGQLDTLRATISRIPGDAELEGAGRVTGLRAYLLLSDRKPDSLLSVLRDEPANVFTLQTEFLPASLVAAWTHRIVHRLHRVTIGSTRR